MSDSANQSTSASPYTAPVQESVGGHLYRAFQQYRSLPAPVYILCVGSFVNRAGSFAILFLTIYISEHLGFGITFAATCFGISGLGSIVASVAGGQLADRFGRRPVMLTALLGGPVWLFCLSFAETRGSILLFLFLFALTLDLYRPAASAMMGDLVTSAERPLAFGLMYIAFNLGFAVAAPVGGFLAEHSFQWLFWGDALTTASYGLIILFLVRETHPGQTGPAEQVQEQVGFADAVRHILSDRIFLLFASAVLMTGIVFMQGFSTLPMHLSQSGYSKQEVGALLSINGILIVILQIPVNQILKHRHRLLTILAGEVLIAIGFGLTSVATSAVFVLITVMIWTIGEVVQAAFKQAFVADVAPASMRGRYMGVFSLCFAISISGGVPLGGWVLEHHGSEVLWAGCFVLSMISVAIYFLIYLLQRGTPQKVPAVAETQAG